jgi:hypothetical protein
MGETKVAGRTAEEWREKAAASERSVQESWERSDTDGFLSQWASGLGAQEARENARIAEAGGRQLFSKLVLETLDGEATDARRVETRYGTRWRLDSTDEWLAYLPERESTLAKKGYREARIYATAEAKARIVGSGTGLSGNAWVQTIRQDLPLGEAKLWRCEGDPE